MLRSILVCCRSGSGQMSSGSARLMYSIQCTFVTFAFPLPGELVDECILLTVLHPEVPAHQREPQGPWGGSGSFCNGSRSPVLFGSGSHISVGFRSEAGSRSRMLTSFNFIAWVNQKILIQNWMFPLLYCLIIVHVYVYKLLQYMYR